MITAVTIDQREPVNIQRLAFGDAPKSITLLPAGDIWIATADGTLLAIERKTSSDLLNTISAGRLLPQLAELVKVSRYAYLMVVGTLYPAPSDNLTMADRGPTGWAWTAIQGALLAAQELGVFTLHVGSEAQIEPTVAWLAERRHEPILTIPPLRIPRILTTGEAILAALPGIGLEKARALIQYCGSAAQALAFLTDMTTSNGRVDGVATGVKTNVRKALELPDWAELALISTEGKLVEYGQFMQTEKVT